MRLADPGFHPGQTETDGKETVTDLENEGRQKMVQKMKTDTVSKEKAESKDKKLTTSRLLSRIRNSGTPQEVLDWHSVSGQPGFCDVLYQLIQQKALTAKEMIRRSRIERSYFYHILSGKKKNPSRNMVLRIGLCAGANLEEMNRLLRLAGTPALYPKIRRDALLIYAIGQKYDMEQTNELLLEHEETPLYREEKHE